MSMTHTLDLIRFNKQARQGVVTSVLLIVILMGWLSIAYARINPYLIILSFPIFNAPFILPMTLFLVRAEQEGLTRIRTIPEGIKKTLVSAMTLSSVVVFVLNVLFEIIAVLLRDFLAEAFASSFTPVDFTPDPLTLIIFIGCNVSFSACLAALGAWLFSRSHVAPPRSGEALVRLEGFVSLRLVAVIVLLGVAGLLIGLSLELVIASVEGSITIMPALVAAFSLGFNVILLFFLWTNAWKTMSVRP